ncbi:MAG: DnaJ domain-containing protein [Nodosilinea sp.]|jgi:curved DNA-binding protein CbpA
MALAHHYRILGLRTGASFGDVKLAYRNLARLYHPDVNPGDQLAKEKFIQVTQAYQALVDALPASAAAARPTSPGRSSSPEQPVTQSKSPTPAKPPEPEVRPQPRPTSSKPVSSKPASSKPAPPKPASPKPAPSAPAQSVEAIAFTISPTPGGSEADQALKVNSYQQLREFFRGQRFPRAVALVEGLVHRFPEDPEVRQWHAITYYRWGHDLLSHGNLAKAEVCLKKAHRVDPHNQSLRQALQKDFHRLARLRQAPVPQA